MPRKPRSLRQKELTALIGAEATRALVAAFGGIRIYIPTPCRLRPGHRLAQALGWEAAVKLCQAYGGTHDFKVPTCQTTKRQRLKARQIRQLRAKCVPVKQIARLVHCTEKAVYEYLKRWEDRRRSAPQLDWTYLI